MADAEAARALEPLSDKLRYKLATLYGEVFALAQDAARDDPTRSEVALLAAWRAKKRLGQVLEGLPAERGDAFWRDQIQADPALDAFRRGPAYKALAARFELAPR